MRVDTEVAAPDAALLSLLVRKKVSKETHPNVLPAARVPGAEKMNIGRAQTRLAPQTVRPADRRQSIRQRLRQQGGGREGKSRNEKGTRPTTCCPSLTKRHL